MAERRNARFGPNEGPRVLRRPWLKLGAGPAPQSVSAPAGTASAVAGAFGAQGFVQPPPILRSTFLQPSINAQYPNITWTQAQFEAEFQWMTSAGIHEIVLQWTVDQDANETYFPYSGGILPPQYNTMVGNCLAAAAACGVDVWLGLCNTANWQAHADDNTWLYNQFYLNTLAATQLMTSYPGQFVGWYVSNEWSDTLYLNGVSSDPAATIAATTSFFQDNTAWLRANTGLPVMNSPANYGGQSASAFAANIAQVCGSFDVINVQDGTGDVGFTASQVTSYFTALAAQFAGVPGVQIWQNADIYGYGTGLPITIPNLSANLAATTGLVSKYCSFSFETQMDPLTTSPVGNYSYYQAYRAYAEPYFDSKDYTANAGLASLAAVAEAPSGSVSAKPSTAMISSAPATAGHLLTTLPGVASATFVAYPATVSVARTASAGLASVSFTVYQVSPKIGVGAGTAAGTATAYAATVDTSEPVFPTVALVGATAYDATVIAFSPNPLRTYLVPFEVRTIDIVSVEKRVYSVPADTRNVIIPAESRTYTVPAEIRTVPAPTP